MLVLTENNKYSIEQKHNQIIINLPQTVAHPLDTSGSFGDRKEKLTESELASLLILVQKMFEGVNHGRN